MIPQEILQSLVTQVANLTPVRSKTLLKTDTMVDEVLLESHVDGNEYYLVRRRFSDQQTVSLSPRERKVAQLVAQGFPNKLIAKQLGIAHWTVATYMRRIFTKLDVNSRAEMIARILENHLI